MLLQDRINLWRNRFQGRQEVFGTKVAYHSTSANKMVSHYVAMFTDQFKSKEARKDRTSDNTTIQEYYVPLGDNHIEGHIKGFNELLIYVLEMDGTVRFAALDFDLEHTFEDVMQCYEIIAVAHQIPCYVARSTTKGYHLYMFFDKPIEAKYVTSYIKHIYEETGFLELHRNGTKHIPETFPKTIALKDPLSTGYGIKPPMQGQGMAKDMNCWVKADVGKDEPVGGKGDCEEQWEFFKDMNLVGVDSFKQMLVKSGISIEDIRLSESRGVVQQNQYRQRTTPYKAPKDGDLNRIIQGCPAMKRFWEGSEKDFKHNARVALITWAMQTKNGLSMLRDRWKSSSECEKHIQYEVENYQQPWTCRAMQEHDLCIKGRDPKFCGGTKDPSGVLITDGCFRKVPPKEKINGKLVINPNNIPESEWADPSPVRIRVELKRVGVKEIKEKVDALDKKDANLELAIKEIYEEILNLPSKKKREELELYLKEKKLTKVKDLKTIAKEAKSNKKIDAERLRESRDSNATVNGIHYAESSRGQGYSIVEIDSEGQTNENEFCNFRMELLKNVQVHSLVKEDTETLVGHILVGDRKLKFEISTDDWHTNTRLAQAIGRFSKTEARIHAYSLEQLRDCVYLFGRYNMKSEHRYEDYGFDSYENPKTYRSAKWNITAETFSGEDDVYVDLSHGGHANSLKIEKITNDEFAKVVNVIKNNYLTFQVPKLTYTTLAHTLQAAVQLAFLPFPEAPVLWVQGLTGAGKSALAKFAQDFHGSFPRLLNVGSTQKAVEFYSMMFKDSLLVLDDYKEAFYRQGTIKLVQNIYDRSSRGRLKQNLDQAAAPFCRGLMMITSEDKPSSEASTLARCIYIEAPQIISTSEEGSTNSFQLITEARKHFSGVTGRFIHYMMATYPDRDYLGKKFFDTFNVLCGPVKKLQNGVRAAQNLAANYMVWELFCDFLKDNMLLTKEEHSKYLETHWHNVVELRDDIIEACGREQASNIFLEILREAIMSGKLRIDGMDNNMNDNATTVGFVTNHAEFTTYIYPTTAVSEVKRIMNARGAPLSHSQDAIGKQLQQDGYLKGSLKGRTMSRKSYRGSRAYVWSLDSKVSGIGPQDNEPSKDPTKEEETNVFSMASYGKK